MTRGFVLWNHELRRELLKVCASSAQVEARLDSLQEAGRGTSEQIQTLDNKLDRLLKAVLKR